VASRAAKTALFDAFASVAGALGNGRRAEIVDVLAQGERSVEELAAEISQSVANTSHHLQQPVQELYASPLTDSNRRPPPYHNPGWLSCEGGTRERVGP
jgi:DNA-binding transcriptional ArsR family regulator